MDNSVEPYFVNNILFCFSAISHADLKKKIRIVLVSSLVLQCKILAAFVMFVMAQRTLKLMRDEEFLRI